MAKKKTEEKKKINAKKDNRILVIATIVIIALIVLVFVFMGLKSDGDSEIEEGEGEVETLLDVGDNPDLGVEDFSSLEVSEEEINS